MSASSSVIGRRRINAARGPPNSRRGEATDDYFAGRVEKGPPLFPWIDATSQMMKQPTTVDGAFLRDGSGASRIVANRGVLWETDDELPWREPLQSLGTTSPKPRGRGQTSRDTARRGGARRSTVSGNWSWLSVTENAPKQARQHVTRDETNALSQKPVP